MNPLYKDAKTQFDCHRVFIQAAEDMIKYHNSKLAELRNTILEIQEQCTHVPELYAEGRHGFDKGTQYFRCTECNYEWED